MKKIVMGLLVAALTFAAWRIVASAQAGAPPNIAFDIPNQPTLAK